MLSFLKNLLAKLVKPVELIEHVEIQTKTEEDLIIERVNALKNKPINNQYASCYVIKLPYMNITNLTDKIKQRIYNIKQPNNNHFLLPNMDYHVHLSDFIVYEFGHKSINDFYELSILYQHVLKKELEKNQILNNVDSLIQEQIKTVISSIEYIFSIGE